MSFFWRHTHIHKHTSRDIICIIEPENSTDACPQSFDVFSFPSFILLVTFLLRILLLFLLLLPSPLLTSPPLVQIFPRRNVIRFTLPARRAVDIFFLPSSSKVRVPSYNVLRSLSRFFFSPGNTVPADVTQYFHCALCPRPRKWISSRCRY